MFGRKTWDDVRASITTSVRRKWPFVQKADVDDAVGDAVLRLVEYWLDLDSSREAILSEPMRAYGFAIWYGTRFAMNRLSDMAEHAANLEWLDAPVSRHEGADEDFTMWDFVPGAEDVESDALSDDPDVLLSQFLDVALADPHRRWTVPIMDGETTVSQAQREGVTQQAVSAGRIRTCSNLRPTAQLYGLAG